MKHSWPDTSSPWLCAATGFLVRGWDYIIKHYQNSVVIMQSVHQCSDGSGRLFVSGNTFYVVSETRVQMWKWVTMEIQTGQNNLWCLMESETCRNEKMLKILLTTVVHFSSVDDIIWNQSTAVMSLWRHGIDTHSIMTSLTLLIAINNQTKPKLS